MKKCIFVGKKGELYYGGFVDFDRVSRVARVEDCRRVLIWHGKGTDPTSLAVYGLCGPRAKVSRIGPVVEGISLLAGVVCIFCCSEVAVTTIDDAKDDRADENERK